MAATWICARCGADNDTQLGLCRACGAVRGAVVTPPAPPLPPPLWTPGNAPFGRQPLSMAQPPMPPAPPSFADARWRGGEATSSPTPTSERTSRGILAGLVLAVILALTAVVAAISVGPRLADEASGAAGPQSPGLEVGECFGSPESRPVLTPEGLSKVKAIPCSERHLFEVFYVGTISGDGVLGALEWTDRYCSATFTQYTGTAIDASPLNYFAVGPDSAGWAAGDRDIRCILADMNLNPLTGSMKASGHAAVSPAPTRRPSPSPSLVPSPSPSASATLGPDTSPSQASASAGQATAPPSGPQVGDCLGAPGSGPDLTRDGVWQAPVLPCSGPHLYEVFRTGVVDVYDYGFGASDWAAANCTPAFKQYVGTPFDQSQLNYVVIGPDEASWTAGDHRAVCMLGDPNLTPLTGSMKGSHR